MSKVISVAKNEIKQQLRRKAIWIGFILIAAVVAFMVIPPTPKNMNPWIDNDIAVCCSISGYLSDAYLLITVLCAGRLCNKKDNYYDILASTPLTKHQFYAGKILGNTMLYDIFTFIMMLIFVPTYFINHYVATSGIMVIPYFLIFYIISCILIILFGVAFIAMLDLLFKNSIISSIIGLLYFLICSAFQNNFFGHYLLVFNGASYYSSLREYWFIPSMRRKSNSLLKMIGYTPQNGFISIFILVAFIVLFYIIGLAKFKMAESTHFKLPKFNKKADA